MRSGKLERWWDLPNDFNHRRIYWHVAKDGFFFENGPGIYFVDWEGRAKRLA
jgi:hypothetical protein